MLKQPPQDARVHAYLQGGEDLGAGGGALEASVQQAVEGAGPILHSLDVVVLTVSLLNTLRMVQPTCKAASQSGTAHGQGLVATL